VLRHSGSGGCGFRKHHEIGPHIGYPAALLAQTTRHDAHPPVQLSEKVLDGNQDRLDLHECQSRPFWLPGDKIYGSPFAILVKGVLGQDLPSTRDKERCDLLDQTGVVTIQDAGKHAPAPSRLERHMDLESGTNPPERCNPDLAQMPAFDSGDHRLMDTGAVCDVTLSHAQSTANCAVDDAYAQVVHGRPMVDRRRLLSAYR
jgi:hypothetical protein